MLISNSKLWVVGELVLAQCLMIVHKVDKVEFNDKTILQHLKYASLFTPENGSMIQSTLQSNLNNETFRLLVFNKKIKMENSLLTN